MTGIEPANPAWKAGVFPLNYVGVCEQPDLHRGRRQDCAAACPKGPLRSAAYIFQKGGRAIPGYIEKRAKAHLFKVYALALGSGLLTMYSFLHQAQ